MDPRALATLAALANLLVDRRYLAAFAPHWLSSVPASLPRAHSQIVHSFAYLFHLVAKQPIQLAVTIHHDDESNKSVAPTAVLPRGFISFFGLRSPCTIPLHVLDADALGALIRILSTVPNTFQCVERIPGTSTIQCSHFAYNSVIDRVLGDRRDVLEYLCNEYLWYVAQTRRRVFHTARLVLVCALQLAYHTAASSVDRTIKGAGTGALRTLWMRLGGSPSDGAEFVETDDALVRRVRLWKATHVV